MKRFMMRNSEGLYLNTEYHSSLRNGDWRPREDARLYKSVTGIVSAFRAATPAIKKHLGIEWTRPRDRQWTDEDREQSSALWKGIASLSGKQKLALWAEDGYIIEEVEI